MDSHPWLGGFVHGRIGPRHVKCRNPVQCIKPPKKTNNLMNDTITYPPKLHPRLLLALTPYQQPCSTVLLEPSGHSPAPLLPTFSFHRFMLPKQCYHPRQVKRRIFRHRVVEFCRPSKVVHLLDQARESEVAGQSSGIQTHPMKMQINHAITMHLCSGLKFVVTASSKQY